MDGLQFRQLRFANNVRMEEWASDGEKPGIAFACMELAGEVGELCNELKKAERKALKMVGGKNADMLKLADEMADVVICVDLIATKLGVDLGAAVRQKFNATSYKNGLQTKFAADGCVSTLEDIR